MPVTVSRVISHDDIQCCFDIRRRVFVDGQNVPEADEWDGLDGQAEHYLLRTNGQPAATARIRYLGEKAKIERVAVLEDYQKQGLGKIIMQYILEAIKCKQGISMAILGAQEHAIGFYEGLGFGVCSESYMDAGIPHKWMQRAITPPADL
jgi:predicted GNAT family N-acyltransferase